MGNHGRMDTGEDVAGAAKVFDRAGLAGVVASAERDRLRVIEEFPLAGWADLPVERYALGAGEQRPFCWMLEYGTDDYGSMRGGSAAKHIMYRHHSGEWRLPAPLRKLDPDEAWQLVRAEFEVAFEAAERKDFSRIDDLNTLSFGQALVTKALAVYFPDEFLPIYSASHVRHFTQGLGGRAHQAYGNVRTWQANRELLGLVRGRPEFDGWHSVEVMRFLYAEYDPRARRRQVWKIAPGERARLWEECREGGHIRVAWDETGDLGRYESDTELKQMLDSEHPESAGANLRHARQLLALRDLEPGDLIVANRGKSEVLALGTVSGGYVYDESYDIYRHKVPVDWDESYAQTFDAPENAWQQTFATVSEHLLRRIGQGRAVVAAPRLGFEAATDDFPVAVQQVLEALEHKGQVILYGPPGTGKTRLALSAALALAGRADAIHAPAAERASALAGLLPAPESDDIAQVTLVTFHPSYGYEDFVEGYKPEPVADQPGLNLQLRTGVFLRICEAAEQSPDRTYLLIIDEINRGDLPRVLGELVTLLEIDKRTIPVKLPISGRQIRIPRNVRVIGTMNTADRSIGHLDVAIRRRFRFVEVAPDLDAVDTSVGGLDLAAFLAVLNSRLVREFGPDHQIGHACLLRDDRPLRTEEELAAVFYHDIVPQIEDHSLGRGEPMQAILGDLIDPVSGRIARMGPQDLASKLAAEFAESDDAVQN